jgi:ribosomal protein S27E
MPNLVVTAADGEKQPIIHPKTVVRCLHCGQMDIVLIAPLPVQNPDMLA